MTSVAYRGEDLGGMESGFAALLGLVVILLLMEDRPTLAGVALGVAVVNKLDAGLLAIAVVAVYLLIDRRPPWRTGLTALAVAAPWFLFSTLYFGSPIPHSATQKLGEEVLANTTTSFKRSWILDILTEDRMRLLILIAAVTSGLVAVLAIRRSSVVGRPASTVLLVAGGWFAQHAAAFSLVDLGDAYPWYTTVLFLSLVLTAALGLFLLWAKLVPAPLYQPVLAAVAVALVAAALVRWHGEGIRESAEVLRSGHSVADFELFEKTRQDAGRVVGDGAEPGDVLATCFGWAAYEAPQTTIDELCLLATRDEVSDPTWYVLSEIEERDDFQVPFGSLPFISFESPTATTYVFHNWSRS